MHRISKSAQFGGHIHSVAVGYTMFLDVIKVPRGYLLVPRGYLHVPVVIKNKVCKELLWQFKKKSETYNKQSFLDQI